MAIIDQLNKQKRSLETEILPKLKKDREHFKLCAKKADSAISECEKEIKEIERAVGILENARGKTENSSVSTGTRTISD